MKHRFRRGLLVLALGLGAALAVEPAAAQAPTRADTAAVLLEAARDLDAAGRGEAADALFALILDRYGDTLAAAQVRALRTEPRQFRMARAGNTELAVWSTLYGLWLGVGVPFALGADSDEVYGLGLLLGGPAGLLAARAYTHDRHVSFGHARAITFGGTWGTWQGIGWSEVADLGVGDIDDDEFQARVAAGIVGGLVGIGVGSWLGKRHEISAGTASMVSFGGFWGTLYGFGLGALFELDAKPLLTSALLAGDAGVVFTALRAPEWNLSQSRARLINIAGIAGLLGGLGLDLLFDPGNEQVAIGIPMVASAIGLVAGFNLTRDLPPEEPGRGGAEDSGAALIRLRDGQWGFGLPAAGVGLDRRGEVEVRVHLIELRF